MQRTLFVVALLASCCATELVTKTATTSDFDSSTSPTSTTLPLPLPATNSTERKAALVIAHRGASGYLPEETLAAYSLAAEQGADYLEIDLIMTKDGHLVAGHDPDLNITTDISSRPEFAARKRAGNVDGTEQEGYFATDFTLAEIKTLHVRQVFPTRPQQLNAKFHIATFSEIIQLTKQKSIDLNRNIGLYIETKNPTYHRQAGLALEPALADALKTADWFSRPAPVILQSFEPTSLQILREKFHCDLQMVQLIDAAGINVADGSVNLISPHDAPYDWKVSDDSIFRQRKFDYLTTDEGLQEVATYANGIGPYKRYIITTILVANSNGTGEAELVMKPTDLIARAHRAGLFVHAYTFRSEPQYLPAPYRASMVNELLHFLQQGLDGIITDFADVAVSARTVFSHMLSRNDSLVESSASWKM